MQTSGRVLVSSARSTVLRLSRNNGTPSVRTFYSRPPPSILTSSGVVQRRGYRRTTVSLKEDDDKRSKTGKDIDKPSPEESDQQKPAADLESTAKGEDSKTSEKEVVSAKDKATESESSGAKERRPRESKSQKTPEERAQPAIITRNQALSLVTNGGGKSRLIITNHDHPETYPQCMALAMSGRPILPGFYSIPLT